MRSSFDGIVTKVLRGPGATVDGVNGNNPTPIVEMAADAALEFVGDATEHDLDLLAIGQNAEITLSSNSASLAGEVVGVARGLDGKTGLGDVRILLVPPANGASDSMRIGSFGHARVHGRSVADALSIPRSALRGAILDGAEVAACANGKAAIRKITVGYRDADRVEVLSGLAATDHVAIGDVLGLTEGTAITETAPSAAASSSESDPP